jgi:hypothetical protein
MFRQPELSNRIQYHAEERVYLESKTPKIVAAFEETVSKNLIYVEVFKSQSEFLQLLINEIRNVKIL